MSRPEEREGLRPRSYRMVAYLEPEIAANRDKLDKTRVMNLPALLLRHGLLQAVVFLEEKNKDLLKLLEGALVRGLGDAMTVKLEARWLSNKDLHTAMFLEELAIEAATWIKRLYAAYEPPVKTAARAPEGR